MLTRAGTEREVRYLREAFTGLGAEGPVVDLGCGHGRHAGPLHQEGALRGRMMGLELDPLSLQLCEVDFPRVRADLRGLPFGSNSLAGAYAWYSSLFIFSDEEHVALLADLARCLRPQARFIFQSVPYERLKRAPQAHFLHTLSDGSVLEEKSHFDAASGRDRAQRTLRLRDGRTMSAAYELRYYPLEELRQMFEKAGLSILWVHGSLEGEPLGTDSTDLIVGAEKRPLRS